MAGREVRPVRRSSGSNAAGRDGATLIVVMLSLCGTVVSLQQTLFLPLLAELPRLLDTSATNVSWLVTSTLLAGAVATPTVSRLADMYGKRRVLLLSLGISVGGSLLGAVSLGVSCRRVAVVVSGSGGR